VVAGPRVGGVPVIDVVPGAGLGGTLCFLHPKGTAGVLVEVAPPPGGAAHAGHAGRGPLAGLALRDVRAHRRAGAAAAELFAAGRGLERRGETAVTVGGGHLHIVAADGPEGLAGLVLEVDDLVAARGALAALGAAATDEGVALAPDRCHGVPITVAAR
jgi:hypothetical protein